MDPPTGHPLPKCNKMHRSIAASVAGKQLWQMVVGLDGLKNSKQTTTTIGEAFALAAR